MTGDRWDEMAKKVGQECFPHWGDLGTCDLCVAAALRSAHAEGKAELERENQSLREQIQSCTYTDWKKIADERAKRIAALERELAEVKKSLAGQINQARWMIADLRKKMGLLLDVAKRLENFDPRIAGSIWSGTGEWEALFAALYAAREGGALEDKP